MDMQFILLLFIAEKEKLEQKYKMSGSIEEIAAEISTTPANVFMQFLLLYKRNIVMAKRSYVSYCLVIKSRSI